MQASDAGSGLPLDLLQLGGEGSDQQFSGVLRAQPEYPGVAMDRGVVGDHSDLAVPKFTAEESTVETAGDELPDGPSHGLILGYELLQ